MNCVKVITYQPCSGIVPKELEWKPRNSFFVPLSVPRESLCLVASLPQRVKLDGGVVSGFSRRRIPGPIYSSSGSHNDPFSMESLRKAMSMREQEQMREKAFGGSGGNKGPPGGGDRGGSGDAGGEGFKEKLDEALQVFLATLGLIFAYIYIIRGDELLRLIRDYMRYIIRGKSSPRLQRAMQTWRRLVRSIIRNEVHHDNSRQGRQMTLRTPTWWLNPTELFPLVQKLFTGSRREQQAQQS